MRCVRLLIRLYPLADELPGLAVATAGGDGFDRERA